MFFCRGAYQALNRPASQLKRKERTMRIQQTIALITLGSIFALPVPSWIQQDSQQTESQKEAHARAEREQTQKDRRKHTGAKVIGGTAAGGAVVGGVAGGGKGALIGGAAGAGAGAIANKVRKDKAVKKREKQENPQ
jgi:hypothetical protein